MELKDRQFEVTGNNFKEIQENMKLLTDAGYVTKTWGPRWGRLLKSSKISYHDLKRLLDTKLPEEYDKRGFVRNRLKNKDWIKYFK